MNIKKVLLPRKNPNDPQIKSYVRAVQAGQKMYHLTSNNGKWVVKKALSQKAAKVFDNKEKATVYAIKVAKNHRTELIIHGKDGRIQDRKSYGNSS
jgi:hypothetical protein